MKWRSLGGRKFGIVFHGLSVTFSFGFWFTIIILLGRISTSEASRGLPSMFYAAIVKRLFLTFFSSAPLPNRFGTSSGVCGDACNDIFPLYLNSRIVWAIPLPRILFFRFLGLLAIPLFYGMFGLRGTRGTFMMCSLRLGTCGGK